MKIIAVLVVMLFAVFAAAIGLGGPTEPPAMASINAPFKNVDWSGLPVVSRYPARDGTMLAYRSYRPEGRARGSVVLIHGSSARGSSMHPLAGAFAAAGYAVHALDVRGHGDSGVRGQIDRVGQLEDDLEDFMRSTLTTQPTTLVGFSAGGGFVLRFAAGPRRDLFANYLLMSPFISQSADTYRPDSGGWVEVGVPRWTAIALLDKVGLTWFNRLPVTRFALVPEAKQMLTSEYSYALADNFRPHRDYRADIRAAKGPLQVVAGQDDEVFRAERFENLFRAEGRAVPVTIVPGVGHIALTLDPRAHAAAVHAVDEMNTTVPPRH